ncbi:MAG TPA: ComEC/Rec2 family competence protein, partial [Bacteroidia bacterium]|nr:ComEC/Rec2 family competence protein [Bacteroidia bacterium]
MRKAPLLVAAFAGSAGIVLVDRGWFAGWLAMAAILSVVAGWAMWRREPVAGILCLAGLCWIGMGMRHQARIADIRSFPLAAELRNGDPVAVSGEGWIAGVVESGERSVKTVLMIEALEIGGRRVPCEHRVPCWIQKPLHGIGYGQLVGFTGKLLPLEGAAVPGGFDAAAFYFRKNGALAKLEIRDGDRAELLPGERGSALVRWARTLRGRFERVVLLGVPPDGEPYARLVAAMALGAREQSPEDLEEWFRISGTIHLFAVSGLHVGIVVGILAGLASLAGLSKAKSVMLIVPLVLFYAVLTGLSPSAVRAAVMAAVFLLGYGLREKPRLLNSLGFAALAILGHDPQQLFLPGFQLSFMVMLAIALMVQGLSVRIARPLTSDPFLPKRLVRRLRRVLDRCSVHFAATLAMSLAAWIGSAGALVAF